MKKIYFYLHIPKTAGTTFNDFLKKSFPFNSTVFHIESKLEEIEAKRVLSGHIVLPRAKKIIPNFTEYTTLTVLRKPIEQLSSHLRYVRKLAEPSEAHRLLAHTDAIKKIVAQLQETDFASPSSLKIFITWLEDENLALFHNTQIQYLIGSRFTVNKEQLAEAKEELNGIDYVGVTERLDDYMDYLSYKLNFKKNKVKNKKLNITIETYGLDINNKEIQKVLEPLICYDKIIYDEAKKKFEKDFCLVVKNRPKGFHLFLDKMRAIAKR